MFYFFSYKFLYVFHALKHWFTILKHSVGSSLHPSLIASEFHCELAMKGRNLIVEAMLITLKDSDTTLAGRLVGWVCINNMTIWCRVVALFCPFVDVTYNRTGGTEGDCITEKPSDTISYMRSTNSRRLYRHHCTSWWCQKCTTNNTTPYERSTELMAINGINFRCEILEAIFHLIRVDCDLFAVSNIARSLYKFLLILPEKLRHNWDRI
jgi:hypothetical protein